MAAPPAIEIIDAHHHLWHYTPVDYAWIGPDMAVLQRDFLPADLATLIHTSEAPRHSPITGSVVVQARQTLEETHWLLDLADATPLIHGVVGWLPLESPDLPAMLHSLASRAKLKGLRHVVQDEPDPDFLLRPAFNRGIDSLADTGLAYDLLILEHQLPAADRFVRLHPRQLFVLDHLAKPRIREQLLQPWHDDLRRLAENPNVVCKLSGLVTEADWSAWTPEHLYPYLDAVLRIFGPERLLAGSDWPVCLLASEYHAWWTLLEDWARPLPLSARRQIFSENARRLYQLSPSSPHQPPVKGL